MIFDTWLHCVPVFGTGAGAQFLLSHGKMATAESGGITWGIGVMMGIYVAGGVSGECVCTPDRGGIVLSGECVCTPDRGGILLSGECVYT